MVKKSQNNQTLEKNLVHDCASRETGYFGPLSDRSEEFHLDSAEKERVCEGNLL